MNLLDLFVKVGVDDQASSQVETLGGKITSKLGSAVKTVGKVMAGVAAGAGAGAIAITKAAVDSYASYEQLVGGVDKLYQGASGKLQQYAQNAYKTAGMSANDYMEQATSFSAALINSLGGDVDKAADQTDKAMRLMSDNVNTFGSDAEAVQNAIQGLSRENYTMLDNLKLGYAGTKEGMQQLIDDANEYARQQGINADLTMGNFSDMIDAIDLIQQKQHIWGTTAKEAMSTIEGSVNMTKAAWQNFLTAIGSGDPALIQSSVTGIIDGIFGAFNEQIGEREGGIIENVLPVVQHVGEAIMGTMPSLAEGLAWNLIEAFNDVFGTNFNAEEIISSIERAFGEARDRVTSVLDGLRGAWDSFSSTFDTGALSDALDSLESVSEHVWGFVESNILPNLPTLGEILGEVANFMLEVGDAVLEALDSIGPFVPAIAGAIAALSAASAIAPIFAAISGAVTFFTTVIVPALGMVQSFGGAIALVTTLLGGPIPIIIAVAGALIGFIATNDEAKQAIVNAWQSFVDFISGIPAWWSGVWEQVTQFARSAVDRLHSMWTDLKNKATTTWNNIKSMISNAMNGAKDAVINAMAALKNGVVSKFNEVVDFVRGIPSRITSAIGDLSGTLKGAGSALIGGLFGGITSKAEEMFNYVSGIAGKIQALKGPLPYDRKVLIPNGVALMQSLQTGLSKGYESLVAPYLSGMASKMAANFDAGMTGAARPVQAQANVPSIYIGEMVVRDRRDADYFARKVSQIWLREMNGALA